MRKIVLMSLDQSSTPHPPDNVTPKVGVVVALQDLGSLLLLLLLLHWAAQGAVAGYCNDSDGSDQEGPHPGAARDKLVDLQCCCRRFRRRRCAAQFFISCLIVKQSFEINRQ